MTLRATDTTDTTDAANAENSDTETTDTATAAAADDDDDDDDDDAADPVLATFDARPDGIPDEYWDTTSGALKVSSMIKRNADLRRQVSENGQAKAPDGGYELPESERLAAAGMTADDPMLNDFLGLFKEIDLPQDKVNRILEKFAEAVPTAAEAVDGLAATMGSGPAKSLVAANEAWLGTFDAPTAAFFRQVANTPMAQTALANIRKRAGGAPAINPGAGDGAAPALDKKALQAIMRETDYWESPEKQKRVADGFAELFPADTAP